MGSSSEFGAFLDPVADKVIFVNSFFARILVDVQVLALVESVCVNWIFPYLEKLAAYFYRGWAFSNICL